MSPSTLTFTVPPLTVPLTVVSDGAELDGPEGLPLQP